MPSTVTEILKFHHDKRTALPGSYVAPLSQGYMHMLTFR